jgi:hypothetical protein
MRRSGYLACGAVLLLAACSSSSGSNNLSGDAGKDASLHEAGSGDASSYESSVTDSSAADAGGDAADASTLACMLPVELTTEATCNTCVEQYCDPAWCTCAEDMANTDDAGQNGCERYAACVSECVATDAGLPTTCAQTICARAPYSTIEQQDGQELLDCVVLHCAADCALE